MELHPYEDVGIDHAAVTVAISHLEGKSGWRDRGNQEIAVANHRRDSRKRLAENDGRNIGPGPAIAGTDADTQSHGPIVEHLASNGCDRGEIVAGLDIGDRRWRAWD